MVDTIRALSALQTILATNGVGAIDAQDVRDFLVSVMPTGRTATKVVAASDSSALEIANSDYQCDGTADEVQIQAAIDALDTTGGIVQLCAGTYNHAATALIDANKRIKVTGYGALSVPGTNVTAWRISQGTGGTALGAVLEGVHIHGSSINGQTGVELRDTDRPVLRDVRIEYCATGLLFRSEAASTGWVEGSKLENVYIGNCTTGWKATVGSGTGSFGETIADNVHVNDCTTGIDWQQNSNFYRSTLSGVTVWVRDNQTGWVIDGNVRGVRGDIAFESLDATPTAIVGISLGANASNTFAMNLDIDFEGDFTSRVSDANSKYIQFRWNGIHYMNHVDAGRLLRARVLGDSNERFGVIANASAGGGWVLGNGGSEIFYTVGEAAELARTTGGFEIPEHADFAAASANHVRLYARDTGGKTELVARFPTGTIQQVAIEP